MWYIYIYSIYIYNGVLLSCKNENPIIFNNIDGPEGYYAEQNQPDRDKYHDCIEMWYIGKSNK